jgi:hypothetical protein
MFANAPGFWNPFQFPACGSSPAAPAPQRVLPEFDLEHPASAEEFAAVAVLAATAQATDETGSALPLLWPRVLHLVSDRVRVDDAAFGVEFVPQCIRALCSTICSHQEGGARGLKKIIAGASTYNHQASVVKAVLDAGAMPLLIRLLVRENVTEVQRDACLVPLPLRRAVMSTIASLCCGQPVPPLRIIAPAIPLAVEMTEFPDAQVAVEAMWTLALITDGPTERIQAVLDSGGLPVLMRLLPSARRDIETPALRTLGNILCGTNIQCSLAIDHGAISALRSVLQAHSQDVSPNVTKAVLWALSNVAAGTTEHVHALIQADVFSDIAPHIASPHVGIRNESQHTVSNALRVAVPADCAAIITSDSFRALLTAASSQRIVAAGAAALSVALSESFDAVAAVFSIDELTQAADALLADTDPPVQEQGQAMQSVLQPKAAYWASP